MANGSGKPPYDPFAPGERTVIKPNPGGRRDASAPSPAAVPPRSGQPGADMWGGQREVPRPMPRPPASPPPQGSYPARPVPAQTPASRPASVAVPELNSHSVEQGPNPILDAARPILLLLSNVRIARQLPQVAPLMDAVVSGIDSLEATLHAKGFDEQQVRLAKYVICATADDIVQNLPSTDKQIWTQYSMLSRYFQVRDSGVGFFDELVRLRSNPKLNFDVLSLMHACLCLGFEGKYRVAGGDVPLQQIRRDLYETLRGLKARTSEDISPHWRGQELPPEHIRQPVPVWAIACSAAGLLLLSFMVFRWLLGGYSEDTAAQLALLHPPGEINLARVNFKPMEPVVVPQTTQLERIRKALADDIAARRLAADYAGKDIVIRLLNDVVFDKGSAEVSAGFVPSIGRIAKALNSEKGSIRVVGHTDDTPLRSTVKFKDNQDLSEKRAQSVAVLLLPGLADPKRLEISGLAETAPIDTANTPEARAKNRRVEIFIPRDDL